MGKAEHGSEYKGQRYKLVTSYYPTVEIQCHFLSAFHNCAPIFTFVETLYTISWDCFDFPYGLLGRHHTAPEIISSGQVQTICIMNRKKKW